MDARRYLSSSIEDRPIQAPSMMRDGPLHGMAHDNSLEPLPVSEVIKRKVIAQEDEIKRVETENRRFAANHATLRQDVLGTQQELQKLQVQFGSIRAEADIELRGLLEKIAMMEADIHDGEMVKKDLQQAHLEARNLVDAKEKLASEVQIVMDELKKASNDFKPLPELHSELDGLRNEHQNLRVVFEYEKGSNIRQVDQMRGMERNLMSVLREVEKLRADVLNAEQRADCSSNQYGAPYSSTNMSYAAGHTNGHTDVFMQNGSFEVAGYGYNVDHMYAGTGQVPPPNYPGAYRVPPVQINNGTPGEGLNPYVYTDPYGRSQVTSTGGLVAEGIHPGNGRVVSTSKDAQNGPP